MLNPDAAKANAKAKATTAKSKPKGKAPSPLSRMVNIIRSKNKGPSPAEETEEDANDNGARGRAARESMEPDEYYRLHSHLHPPESVLKQFDKHPLAVQVRQSHSV